MDSLTHLVLGAAIGEALLGKKMGRKAMLIGAFANTIPDFDVFAAPCYTSAEQLMVHRGITHSFFFVLLISPSLGWLFSKWLKKFDIPWQNFTALFALELLTHILLDSLTAYGTGWFEPFSNYRVAFNTIFVADPFYTVPFLTCILVALISKNNSAKQTKWNKIGLWLSTSYLVFTGFNKWYIDDLVRKAYTRKNISSAEFVTTPTPLNNFLWMTYSPDQSGYWFGYYSLFDKTKDINFYHVNKNDSLLRPFDNEEAVKVLKQFSKNQYVISKHDSVTFFNDIRFGQSGGWDGPDSSFVFSFRLDKNADHSASFSRTKFKVSFSDALVSLASRIKGK